MNCRKFDVPDLCLPTACRVPQSGSVLYHYVGGNRKGPRIWESYEGKKKYAERFTIRWMVGTIRWDTVPEPLDNGDIYGWLMYDGSLPSKEQMVVQPGSYNGNKFHSRSYQGIEGDWYRRCYWDRVLQNRPPLRVNHGLYGRYGAGHVYIHDAQTARDMGRTAKWAKNDMYWKMTKDYIEVYRRVLDGELKPMARYGRSRVKNGHARVSLDLPADKPLAVLACVTRSSGSPASARVTSTTADATVNALALDGGGGILYGKGARYD